MECHGELGAEICQLPWSTMESLGLWSTGTENWCGEVVWKPGSFHGVPWIAQCGYWTFSWSTMRSRSCGESSHSGVLLGISMNLWSICVQRVRPTVDVNLSSGHSESVRTRLVLISCLRSCTLHGSSSSLILVLSRLFCLRLVSSTCHPCLLDRWLAPRLRTRSTHSGYLHFQW